MTEPFRNPAKRDARKAVPAAANPALCLAFSTLILNTDGLTGYNQRELEGQLNKQKDFETFFKEAPKLNPSRTLIKGVICGVRVEDIQEPTMREIRYLDKLIDELAKGKSLAKILRK